MKITAKQLGCLAVQEKEASFVLPGAIAGSLGLGIPAAAFGGLASMATEATRKRQGEEDKRRVLLRALQGAATSGLAGGAIGAGLGGAFGLGMGTNAPTRPTEPPRPGANEILDEVMKGIPQEVT